ncbi:PucR family transcriptional regulator [Millisia brevis]|uniref:PucR family transcriptional regulator n=1 Tax=Millisia brevis TaxID=264148 RepID=UPI000831E0FC|nr:helix-turn-helix domain-containing protein [Millisia brevis]
MATMQDNIAETITDIATALSGRLADLSADLSAVLYAQIPELHRDQHLYELLNASVEGNLSTILYSLQHHVPPENLETPAAAAEYARRLAQHGVPVHALVRAYRIGNTNLLPSIFEQVERLGVEPELRVPVIEAIMMGISGYIDRVSEQVVAVHETERDRWSANRTSLRALRVQEILAGHDRPGGAGGLDYALDQHHLAVVCWTSEDLERDELHLLQTVGTDIAGLLGAPTSPLFVPIDRVTGWLWIPLGRAAPAPLDLESLCLRMTAEHPAVTTTLGAVGAGIEGFRRSHVQAERVRSLLLAAGSSAPTVASYDQPGVATAALLIDDPAATGAWVRETLGGLADDTDGAARLRETLSAFLDHNLSNVATGKALNLHHNSVKYRVRRATEARGRPLDDDRLGLELALLVSRWLGPSVLRAR